MRFGGLAARFCLLVVISLFLGANAGAQGNSTIAIDGVLSPGEWEAAPPLGMDPGDDGDPAWLDIMGMRGFIYDGELVFAARFSNPDAGFCSFGMGLRLDGNRDVFLFWDTVNTGPPGINENGMMSIAYGARMAFDGAIEGRIPLDSLGNPQEIRGGMVMISGGECHNFTAQSADEMMYNEVWQPASQPVEFAPLQAPSPHNSMFDGHPAEMLVSAPIIKPQSMEVGPDGAIYVADDVQRDIFRIDPADGSITPLEVWRDIYWGAAGPTIFDFDSQGNLWVGSTIFIAMLTPDGDVSYVRDPNPMRRRWSLVVGPDDRPYFATEQGAIERVEADGTLTIVAQNVGPRITDLQFGVDGTLYAADVGQPVKAVNVETGQVRQFTNNIPFTIDPVFLAIDPDGDVWVRGVTALVQYGPNGQVKPFMLDGIRVNGNTSLVYDLDLSTAGGIKFDAQGRIWFASYDSGIMRLDPQDVQPYTASGTANARTCPQLDCEAATQLATGQELAVTGVVAGANVSGSSLWYAFELDGQTLYVHSSLVNSGQDATAYTFVNAIPGFAFTDLVTGSDGTLYGFNVNARPGGELWAITPQGDTEVLWTVDDLGQANLDKLAGLAMGDGVVFVALPYGEIMRYDLASGTATHYADVRASRIVVGSDGALYAAQGDFRQPRTIVRIPDIDVVEPFLSQVAGMTLDRMDVALMNAPNGDLMLFDSGVSRLFRAALDGSGELLYTDPFNNGTPGVAATAPNGDIWINIHGNYLLKRYRPSDGSILPLSRFVTGDPLGMTTSPDGRWLYVAESGMVTRFPLEGMAGVDDK